MLKKLPIQLLIAFILGYFINWPIELARGFYTISQIIKSTLIIVLPFFIFGCISSAILKLYNQTRWITVLLIFGMMLSTFTAIWFAYSISVFVYPQMHIDAITLRNNLDQLQAYFQIPFRPIFSSEIAVVSGIIAGLIANKFSSLVNFINVMHRSTGYLFQKSFIPLLPLYVFGFIVKLSFDGVLTNIFKTYGNVFLLTILTILIYSAIFYIIAFNGNERMRSIKRMLAPAFTGFCTSSSAASMPFTIKAVEANVSDKSFAEFVVPSTVNLHMMGDNINTVLSAIALLIMMGAPIPSAIIFLKFSFIYLMTSLSFSAVPGGIVLILLPILEKNLGMPSDAAGLFIGIMALMDPFVTAGNIVGNGAFAQILHRFYKKPQG